MRAAVRSPAVSQACYDKRACTPPLVSECVLHPMWASSPRRLSAILHRSPTQDARSEIRRRVIWVTLNQGGRGGLEHQSASPRSSLRSVSPTRSNGNDLTASACQTSAPYGLSNHRPYIRLGRACWRVEARTAHCRLSPSRMLESPHSRRYPGLHDRRHTDSISNRAR